MRLFKTRSIANEAVKQAKVLRNNQAVKASTEIKVNDEISIRRAGGAVFSYRVIQLQENRLSAKLVPLYVEDITPEEEKEKFLHYHEAQKTYREMGGYGRPSKKNRRKIDGFLGS